MADLPCPNCGTALTYLEQYHRHYCLRCGQYAPEGYGDQGARRCPTCGGVLSFVGQYGRFYCYRCSAYAPDEPTPAAVAAPVSAEPSAAPTSPTPPAVSPSSTDLVAAPSPPDTTLVAAAAPTAATPTPALSPEPAAGSAPDAETKPAIAPAPSATPGEPTPAEKPAEPIPTPPSPEIRKLAASKPAIVRVKIFTLKKPELMDLSRAYGLDDSGTKEQVQQRLLTYLHGLETEGTPRSETETPAPSPGHAVLPTPEPAPSVEPAPVSVQESSDVAVATGAAATVVHLEKPATAPKEPAPEPAPVVVEVPHATPKMEHPCPTCNRELTFISQYDRYYCYFCQRYAPAARAKGACPTCGATMRWIDQHQRWWCDSCQKYAPADFPKPVHATAVASRATAAATAATVSRPAIVIHHHANPAAGMGLIGVGIVLWVFVEFFGVIAPAANLGIGNPFTDLTAAITVFFAFIFVAAGMLLGLSSLRDRF